MSSKLLIFINFILILLKLKFFFQFLKINKIWKINFCSRWDSNPRPLDWTRVVYTIYENVVYRISYITIYIYDDQKQIYDIYTIFSYEYIVYFGKLRFSNTRFQSCHLRSRLSPRHLERLTLNRLQYKWLSLIDFIYKHSGP